jgi:hypothetical protein
MFFGRCDKFMPFGPCLKHGCFKIVGVFWLVERGDAKACMRK